MRRLKELNDACLLRLAWFVVTEVSLWAIWFNAGYYGSNSIWHPSNPKNGSTIWKKLRSLSSFPDLYPLSFKATTDGLLEIKSLSISGMMIG